MESLGKHRSHHSVSPACNGSYLLHIERGVPSSMLESKFIIKIQFTIHCLHASSTASPDANAASSAVAADRDVTVIPAVDVSSHVVAVGDDSSSAANAAAPSFEAAPVKVTSSAIASHLAATVNPVVDMSSHGVAVGKSFNNVSDAVAPLTEAASAVSSIINKK